MADDDYRLRIATALVTRFPVGILVDAVMAVRDDQLDAAHAVIAHVRALHPSYDEANAVQNVLCLECATPAPCPTRRTLDGPDLSEVSVRAADLDLVMNHAGDPATVAEYPAAAQRIQDAIEGGQHG